jgi:tetratricopeptide (TPR) repeat protein
MLGCREVELTAMQKADAVEFFHKQTIKGTHTEIEAACEPYGYHPLSLRLLAGRILKDFENPADIAVAQRLKIDGDIIQQKHHVLEVSYNSLPHHEQKLLSTIACFRSPTELKMLEAISKTAKEEKPKGLSGLFKKKMSSVYTGNIDTDLKDLIERGLLHFDDKNKKFDLHPIVRRFAYDRLTAADRTGAHERLVNYFEAVPKPKNVKTLEDLAPVIELYHHMVRAGNLDEAWKLFCDRIWTTLYYQLGGYQLQIELLRALFLDGEDKPPRLKDESAQAKTLNELANAYSLSGQPRRAVPVFQNAVLLVEKMGNKQNVAIGLGNVAIRQLGIGALSDAERNLRRRINLCREIADEGSEAIGHLELGRILTYCDVWQDAEQELAVAEKVWLICKRCATEW